jgi:transposase InsO family protein
MLPKWRAIAELLRDRLIEALAIEVDFNLPAERVGRVLERIAAVRGYPLKLRSDNGPEFIAVARADWAEEHWCDVGVHQTRQTDAERFH